MVRYALSGLLLVLAASAHAGESGATRSSSANASSSESRNDHDDARDALRRGKAMPLTAILEIAARRQPGTVIEVHLRTRKERLIYQLEVLGDDGRRWQLKLDARDGKILSVEDD